MRTRLRAWMGQFLEGVLPLMQWEMRSYVRGARGPFILLLSTGAVILLAGICIPITFGIYDLSAYTEGTASIGHQFYGAFLSLEGLLVLLLMPVLTINSISGEVRRGTLEALLLTRLRPIDIVLGKVLGAFAFFALLLLALLPVLAIVFTVGGVSLSELLIGYLLLLAAAFCAGATGCFASGSSRSFSGAVVITVIFLMIWFGVAVMFLLFLLPIFFVARYNNQFIHLLRQRMNERLSVFLVAACAIIVIQGWYTLLILLGGLLNTVDDDWYLYINPAGSFYYLVQPQPDTPWLPLALVFSCVCLAIGSGMMLRLAASDVGRRCMRDKR
ncbi:MAG: hypothetical protein ACYDCO_04600 [Armatimonadota bacterium]